MEQLPTPQDALNQVLDTLTPRKRGELSLAIESLQLLINPPRATSGPGSFWQDPERGAKARAAMKAAWKARSTTKLQVSWRTSGTQEIFTTYEEVAELVGRAPHTVRIYISKGKGLAYFAHNDDIITVRRL